MAQTIECPHCGGVGRICPICSGSGVMEIPVIDEVDESVTSDTSASLRHMLEWGESGSSVT